MDRSELLGKLRCLATLLQQLNAQTAAAAVVEAVHQLDAPPPPAEQQPQPQGVDVPASEPYPEVRPDAAPDTYTVELHGLVEQWEREARECDGIYPLVADTYRYCAVHLKDRLQPPPAEQASGERRWVTQTAFYDPANPDACTGNCTEAAIASILGIRLDEVPSWAGMKSPEFWFAVEGFFTSRGFTMLRKPGNYVPECLYLASGQSPRGCSHMVVMRDGKLVHDPHPSRAGIDPVEHVWLIVPLDPATHHVEVRGA